MTTHDLLTLAIGITLGTLLCLAIQIGGGLLDDRRNRRRTATRRAAAALREQA
ncbi:hypothetical protein [Streptomyces sp. NPDC002666]